MNDVPEKPIRISLLALPESTGSVLYGLYDILTSVCHMWREVTGEASAHPGFEVRIVAPTATPFTCFGGVPVHPDADLAGTLETDIILVTDLAVDLEQDPRGRWPETVAWLVDQHRQGTLLCSVCTGSLLLAETGLLDGREATIHWAFKELFARSYPAVNLKAERIFVPSGPGARIITTGGAGTWEDLALYLISHFCGETEAVKTAKIFLLGDRTEGQLPFAAVTRPRRHEDAVIADCQVWIADNYAVANPVSRMVERSGLAERTFKRRFKAATGYTPVEYVQTLRIEEAKQQLETTATPTDDIGAVVGYEDPAFFRRLFKRQTGVTPARYRQRVRSIGSFGMAEGAD